MNDLNNEDIIVFKETTDPNYVPGEYNTVKVEDLIKSLELLPELRALTQNIKEVVGTTSYTGGSIRIKLVVEHNTTTLP